MTIKGAKLVRRLLALALPWMAAQAPAWAVPPTVTFFLPSSATVSTLGGGLSGRAMGPNNISGVVAAIRNNASGKFFDWSAESFNLFIPSFKSAVLSPPVGQDVAWMIPFSDANLNDGTSYYVLIRATDSANQVGIVEATITYRTGHLMFGQFDGEGTALVSPAISSGCQPVLFTTTFTVGPNGIFPGFPEGGAVAFRIPDGWTTITGIHTGFGPPPIGKFKIASSPSAMLALSQSSITVHRPSYGNVLLGRNWIVLSSTGGSPPQPFNSGDEIYVTYQGFPPQGPQGLGDQIIQIRSQKASGGSLLSIGQMPVIRLTANIPAGLRFNNYDRITLGPLQTSPTMHFEVTDACGNETPANTPVTVFLSAGVYAPGGGFAKDTTAQFFRAGTGALINSVGITSGDDDSEPFYYRTSTSGINFELIRGTFSIPAGIFAADRPVMVSTSAIALSNVSVDTGTLLPGTTSAVLALGQGAQAIIRFGLSDPNWTWEVVIATDAATFFPPVFRAFGFGDRNRPIQVAWNGLDCEISSDRRLCRFVPPGIYKVLIRAAGGVIEQKGTLEIRVPSSAFIYGDLGASGAGASVRVEGPGAGFGHFAIASSTGYFQIVGLQNGSRYNVFADTESFSQGQRVFLSTASFGVTAALSGGNAGAFSFAQPAFLRVNIVLPMAAPRELWGEVFAHNANFSRQGRGTLHFQSGSLSSDDGAQARGQTGSTWTAITLPPDTYDVDVQLFQIGISSRLGSVVVPPGGGTVDLRRILNRGTNVFGYVILPATTSFGAPVSIHAAKQGDRVPSLFTDTFIPPADFGMNPTSATYALFGLAPGSWTVTAQSRGFISVSSPIFITGASDIGNPITFQGGLDLPLGAGRVLRGTVTVLGDSSRLTGVGGVGTGFRIFVQAYNPASFEFVDTPVSLATNSVVTSATFTITGLSTGTYQVNAFLQGFEKDPPGPSTATVTTGPPPSVSILFRENSSRARFDIHIPPLSSGMCHSSNAYKSVGFAVMGGPDVQPIAYADITQLESQPGVVLNYHCSSMTLLSPTFGNGFYAFNFTHGPSGNAQSPFLPLSNQSTGQITVRLDQATFTVSGVLSLSGNIALPQGSFNINVSSVAGLLANSNSASYCLLSSSLPVAVTNARLELIPLDLRERSRPGPLKVAEASCLSYPIGGASGSSGNPAFPSLIAYIGVPNATGYYEIRNVPAGTYFLRNVGDLDGNPANGNEIAEIFSIVRVSGNTPNTNFEITGGVNIQGKVLLPRGTVMSRPVEVSLADGRGQKLRSVILNFNNQGSVSYAFDKIADGRYTLRAQDFGFPKTFVAKPLPVQVAGGNVQNQDLQFLPGGSIKGKLAVEQVQPDGNRTFVLITPQSRSLLPPNTQVSAVANPWVLGGFIPAQGENCGPEGCGEVLIDSSGQFTIQPVLPGLVYDVAAEVPVDLGNFRSGGLSLVSAVKSGVSVNEGQIADVGVLRLRSSLTLSGRVTDAVTNAPLSNITVQAQSSIQAPSSRGLRQQLPRTQTDRDGKYQLTGLDPDIRYYDVYAAFRDQGEETGFILPYEQKIVLGLDVRSTTTLNFSLIPAPFSIAGRVLGVANLPLAVGDSQGEAPGALIFLEKLGVAPVKTPIGDIMHHTQPDGNFTIPSLSSGAYRMRVTALGYSGLSQVVQITTVSLNLGTLQLGLGAALSGNIRKSDGSNPSQNELRNIAAVTADFSDVLLGTLELNSLTRTISGYRLSGFRPNVNYRIILITESGQPISPPEGQSVVFQSSGEVRSLDIVLKPPKPFVLATSRRSGSNFLLEFTASHPLRSKTSEDDSLSTIITTLSARGSLSDLRMDSNRLRINANYALGVNESSFTLRFRAFSAFKDPDSLDSVNPEFLIVSTFSFFAGIDGYHRSDISNFNGGDMVIQGDSGRLKLPSAALPVAVSSSVLITFQKANELLTGVRTSGLQGAQANIEALRYRPEAYPEGIFRAMTATPPTVNPFSGFYEILLPLGVRTQLSKAVDLTLQYSTGTADPSKLNVYWYNEAANAYVLEQNFGASPVIDTVNQTITIKVNHFSTFVLFDTGVAVISGNSFAGGEIEAFNFPNPFDLSTKQVTPIHGISVQTVRGTMVRIALPTSVSGDGTLKIFNVAGEKVRTIDLGNLTGGLYYYQPWDGRNDSGRDVASGVYIGQVKVGGKSKFFKMALIK